jgi:hypothetical protein
MSWFHNSQLREWVHGCVTAAISHPPPHPEPPSTESGSPSKILAAAAAASAVTPPPRSTHVVVDKAKVIIEVAPSAALPRAPSSHLMPPMQLGGDTLLLRHVQPIMKGPSITGSSGSSPVATAHHSAASAATRLKQTPASKLRAPSTPTRSSTAAAATGSRSSSAGTRRPYAAQGSEGEWQGLEQRAHNALAER